MSRLTYLANLAAHGGRTYRSSAGEHGSDDGMGSGGSDDAGKGEGGEDTGDKGDGEDDAGEDDAGEDDAGEDGERKISDAEAKLLKDVMKSKDRQKTTQKELDDTKALLQSLKGAMGDSTPEQIADLLKGKKAKDVKDLESKGEYDRIVKAMGEENQLLIDGKDSEISTLAAENATLQSQITELTIGRAFSDSKHVTQDLTLPLKIARKEFEGHFELNGTDVVGYDKPKGSSDRTPLVDSQGNNLNFEQAIAKLVKDHPDSATLLRSKARPGAKSISSEKPGAKATDAPVSGLSRIEKALKK